MIGLLAVGMTTVHSKRQVFRVGDAVYQLEARVDELARRNNELDTKLAEALKPQALRAMVVENKMNLRPPSVDKVVLVRPVGRDREDRYYITTRNTVQPRPSRVVVQN